MDMIGEKDIVEHLCKCRYHGEGIPGWEAAIDYALGTLVDRIDPLIPEGTSFSKKSTEKIIREYKVSI